MTRTTKSREPNAVTTKIDRELLRKAKIIAAQTDQAIRDVLNDALRGPIESRFAEVIRHVQRA